MKDGKITLNFIDPILGHSVYDGWILFFSKYFSLHLFSLENNQKNNNHFTKLSILKKTGLKSNAFLFFEEPKTEKNDIKIIGDIFMNNLSFNRNYLKDNLSVFYSEFYTKGKNRLKIILFCTIRFFFFRNKKIIVPHKLGEETFRKISNKVFYLPQLYCSNVIDAPVKRKDTTIKFLYVGRISQYYKNVEFMIRNFLELDMDNCELLLAGKLYDISDNYLSLIKSGKKHISYLGEKSFSELEKLYQSCDFLILPSKSEPIGAVVQEAMANGCIPIVSDCVGSGGYIDDGINGFLFKSDNDKSFVKILKKTSSLDCDLIHNIKKKTINKIKNYYWVGNVELLENYYFDFLKFLKIK